MSICAGGLIELADPFSVSRATAGPASGEPAPVALSKPDAYDTTDDFALIELPAAIHVVRAALLAADAPVAAEAATPAAAAETAAAGTPSPAEEPATPTPAASEPPGPGPDPVSDFYLPDVPWGGPSWAEQVLLDGVNSQRANAGLAPYVFDEGLAHIGRIRSRQMADQGYFGHTDPYGYEMYTELLAYFGYEYAWAGENIARNNYGADEAPSRTLTSLMNSSTHRANILAGDFTRIGIGEYTTAEGMHYFTMIFLS